MSCSPAVTLHPCVPFSKDPSPYSAFFFFGLASSSFLRGVLDHYDLLPSHPLRRCMLSNIVTTPDGRYKSRTSYLLIALKYQIIFDVVKFRLFLRGEACGEKLAKYSSFLRNRDHFYAQVKIENVLNKVWKCKYQNMIIYKSNTIIIYYYYVECPIIIIIINNSNFFDI